MLINYIVGVAPQSYGQRINEANLLLDNGLGHIAFWAWLFQGYFETKTT